MQLMPFVGNSCKLRITLQHWDHWWPNFREWMTNLFAGTAGSGMASTISIHNTVTIPIILVNCLNIWAISQWPICQVIGMVQNTSLQWLASQFSQLSKCRKQAFFGNHFQPNTKWTSAAGLLTYLRSVLVVNLTHFHHSDFSFVCLQTYISNKR